MSSIKGITPPAAPPKGLMAAKMRALAEIKKRMGKKDFIKLDSTPKTHNPNKKGVECGCGKPSCEACSTEHNK